MDISVKEEVKLKKKFSAENMLEIWDSKKRPNSRKIEIGEGEAQVKTQKIPSTKVIEDNFPNLKK